MTGGVGGGSITGGGGGTNATWAVNDADALLPLASRAVQVTVVSPTGSADPDAGRQATDGDASTTSVAVGETYVSVADVPDVVRLTSAGIPERSGAVVSTTVIVKEPLALSEPLSVAVQSTVVVPSGRSAPTAGLHVDVGSTASSGSVAATV